MVLAAACADETGSSLQDAFRAHDDTAETAVEVPVVIDVVKNDRASGLLSVEIERPPQHGTVTVQDAWQPLTVYNHESAFLLDGVTGALLEPHPRTNASTSLMGTDGGKDDEANNTVYPFPFPDSYGVAVTLAGDYLFVSAIAETNRHSAEVVGGGAIYIYRRQGSEWIFSQKLDGGEAGDPWRGGTRLFPTIPGFFNLAADEDDLLVGVASKDGVTTEDAVWVYRLYDTSDDGIENPLWHYRQKLTRPVPEDFPPEFFGTRVAMHGRSAFIVSNHEDHSVTERANRFDLATPSNIRFTPSEPPEGFLVSHQSTPFDTIRGTDLELGDDESAEISFPTGFPFLGTTYTSVWVNSDGNISLGEGHAVTQRSAAGHVDGPPRISPLLVNLDPGSRGSVRAAVHADRVVITWLEVPRLGVDDSNTFQAVLYEEGTIDFVYGQIEANAGVVGIARGNGLGPVHEVDLSTPLSQSLDAGAIFEEFRTDRVANAGAVFAYRQQTDGTWAFSQVITQPDGITQDATFGGNGIALYEDRAMISAEMSKGYVFELVDSGASGGSWRWTGQTLTVFDNPARDSTNLNGLRGSWTAPSIDGDWLVAGSPRVPNNQNREDPVEATGSALFYRWNSEAGVWEFQQEGFPRSEQAGARFGRATALHGEKAVIGADMFDVDADADGVPDIENAGAAFVFEHGERGWRQLTRLEHPEPRPGDALTNSYGSISLSEPFLAIGMFINAARFNAGPLSGTNAGRAVAYATRPLVVYTPDPGFHGVDEFEYLLRDETGRVGVATVEVRTGSEP